MSVHGFAFCPEAFLYDRGVRQCAAFVAFRSQDFVKGYGLCLEDGPLKGLAARAVIVVDEAGKVSYTQLVSEISSEPDYDAALKAVE